MNKISAFTGYQKFIILVSALTQFTVVLDFMVLSPLGDFLMKSLTITPAKFGIVVSAYAFSAGISGILAAGFADKYDRKKLLLFFYIGFILGTLFCGLANSFTALLMARIFTGIFGGVIGSIGLAIVTDLFEVNQRGRVMGFIQMSFAASQILGIPIGLYFANIWGWHAPFFMIVILASLVALAMFFKMNPVNEHLKIKSERNAFRHLLHVLFRRDYRIGYLATSVLPLGGYLLMPFGSAYLINNIQISPAQLPLVFLFTGISSILVMPLIGKLSDRFNKFAVFTAGSILSTIMVLYYTQLNPVPVWHVVIVNMIMFAGIMGRIIPATTLNTTIPDLQDRGAFMSLSSSLQQMAGGIASVCAGYIISQKDKMSPLEHYPLLGMVVSIAILSGILFTWRVYKMAMNKAALTAGQNSPNE